MIVIPWVLLMVCRDIFVAAIAVFAVWFLSILIRFGDDINDASEKKWIAFLVMVAFVALLFRWEVVAVR